MISCSKALIFCLHKCIEAVCIYYFSSCFKFRLHWYSYLWFPDNFLITGNYYLGYIVMAKMFLAGFTILLQGTATILNIACLCITKHENIYSYVPILQTLSEIHRLSSAKKNDFFANNFSSKLYHKIVMLLLVGYSLQVFSNKKISLNFRAA